MLSSRIACALRSAAPALALASVVAAGGSVAAAAPARQPLPCDDGTSPLLCVETTTPPPTVTETVPVEEPPPETEPSDPAVPPPDTEPVDPAAPPPAVTTTTRATPTRTRRTPPPTTTASKPPPRTTTTTATTSAWSSGSIVGGGTRIARPPYNGTPTLSGGPYVFPVIGATSFSDTWGAARATVGWHHGVDIFAPLASPIVAVADGVLFSVGWNTVGGWRLWLRDREGNFFYYAHLSAFSVIAADGARVRAGTVIGFVGNTGDAAGTPYHLHFEIHPQSLLSLGYDGAVNPFPYVSAWQRLANTLAAGGAESSVARIADTAPIPGAILLGFTDISSADGLSHARLEQTLEEPVVAEALVAGPEPPTARSNHGTIRPPREDDARIARSLDVEAARPARYEPRIWDALAGCESGGDWSANTGNGYVGGLQFLPRTWDSHGGSAFAPSAHAATRDQQIEVAERVLDSQGWTAWPACSAVLGLQSLAGD